MRVPLVIVAAIIALTGVLVSCGDSEEIAPATATPGGQTAIPTTQSPTPIVPADLPPAAEGYGWFVTPKNGAFDYDLPLYAVQMPSTYTRIPEGPFYGNPEQFGPESSARFRTRIMVKITPPGPWTEKVFKLELPWQGGGLCGFLPDGEIASELGRWSLYQFKCPETETVYCATDDQQATITCAGKEGPSLSFFDGRAAEIRIGEYFCSIVVFRPGGDEQAGPAFQQAISSFTLR